MDFPNLLRLGEYELQNITNSKFSGLLGLCLALEIFPEAIFLSKISLDIRQSIYAFFHNKKSETEISDASAKREIRDITIDLSENFVVAHITQAIYFIQANLLRSEKSQMQNSTNASKYTSVSSATHSLMSLTETCIKAICYLYKISHGQFTLEESILLTGYLSDANKILHPNGNSMMISNSQNSRDRIKKLLDTLESKQEPTLVVDSCSEKQIIVEEYKLKLNNTTIVDIPKLTFAVAKFYAITGASGGGKTTFLKSLCITLPQPFQCYGKLVLPQDEDDKKSVMLIDQKTYIPARATLFEAITLTLTSELDDHTKDTLTSRVKELFDELLVDPNHQLEKCLHDNKYNPANLSGGQMKKVAVIRAILAQPKVLLGDELFTRLDDKSTIAMLQAFKKYFQNTTVVLVDHETTKHNSLYRENMDSNFYDDSVNIEDYKPNLVGEDALSNQE